MRYLDFNGAESQAEKYPGILTKTENFLFFPLPLLLVLLLKRVQQYYAENANAVCLMLSGQECLWSAADLHAFYWLVWDLGRKPELMPLLPLQTDARHP